VFGFVELVLWLDIGDFELLRVITRSGLVENGTIAGLGKA